MDTFGNAYVTGTTLSANFPVTPGSWNTLCGGDGKCGASYNPNALIVSNAFVTKLNVAGSGLVYSTYLGEYEHVRGQAIAVDANENAYVTGFVEQNGVATVTITPPNTPPPPFIPTSLAAAAFQGAFGGGASDAFVAKLSATGTTVLYLSYLGGSNEDIGYGIAADNTGVAYVTGLTYSTDFPTVGGPLQASFGGAGDAFVAKVNTGLTGGPSLAYSTYLGGTGLDQGNGIALDSLGGTGNIYVAGTTNSNALGIAANGFQPANNGQGDAFALKLTPTGALTYLTFLGGSQADAGIGIAADSTGNAYVTGSTVSTDFPVVGSVFQKTFGGGNADAFVTKISPTGASIIYSSYLGGTNTDVGNSIAVDTNGSAYIAGQTCSQDFPLANPLQPGPGGNCDAFISKVSTQGGISLTPAGLSFAAQSLNSTSTSQTITLSNINDTASVTISNIAITGDFAQTNTCLTAPIVAGANCAIIVTFTPTVAGIRQGSITITDTATGSPQVVNLTGSSSSVILSPSNLNFGTQNVGVVSSSQAITLTNGGASTLTISGITASGDFTETNTCSVPLIAGTNCAILVTYKPSIVGTSVGALTISDDAPGSPQIVLLQGNGGANSPNLFPSTTSLAFGNQIVGVASSPQAVTITNNGGATLTISSVAASGDFSQTNSCSAPLPKNTTCVINVTYKPSAVGSSVGAITINDNAPGNPHSISLTGTGVSPVPAVTLTPTSLSFGNQPIGVVSTPQSVTITNSGTGTLTISSISASGDFAETDACTAPLPAGTNCVMNVTYKPSGAGASVGAITITDNAAGSPHTVHLTGTGVSSGFSFSVPLASATVSAGQIATYTLTVTPVAGFSQPVAITCGNLPRDASCTISPNPVTITGTAPSTVTISVATGLRTLVPGNRQRIDPLGPLRRVTNPWAVPIVLALALAIVATKRRRPALAVFGLAAALLLVSAGCGGGRQAGVPAGTPAGAYQITVTGTAGSLTNSTTLTLQVN